MLRDFVMGLAAVLTTAGVVLLVAIGPTAFQPLVFGLVLLAGTAFERWRYKRLARRPPGPRFRRTPERFRDDATGAAVTVYVDPATGERAYVQE